MRGAWSLLIVAVLLALPFAHAIPDNVPFANETEQARELVDQNKWTNIGQQWQDYFLTNNHYIAGANAFLHYFDGFFVVVMATPYSMTLTFFFVFLLWLFTLLSAINYISFKDSWVRFGVGLAITILVAQIQIFNKVAEAMVKVMLYRKSGVWSFITFLFLVIALAVYLYVNRVFARYFAQMRARKKQDELEHTVKVIKVKDERATRASNS